LFTYQSITLEGKDDKFIFNKENETYGTSLSTSYALSIFTLAAATAAVRRRRSLPEVSASFSNVANKT
jgi:hypothetical protein